MKTSSYFLAFLIAVTYLAFNISVISYSHFDEDAYILYRYADMFNKGYGITYYPNASPIEGATDFLWLIMIIGISKLGFDIGTSAIILNSVGVFLVTLFLSNVLSKFNVVSDKIIFGSIAVFWLLFYPTMAALGGFSVLLYCGLFIIPLYYIDHRKNLQFIPLFSILLGLFRPDGVLLGTGLATISLYYIYSEKRNNIKKIFFINSFIAIIIGIVYFFWRYQYFGNILPLPLYVKQTGGAIVNLKNNIHNSLFYKHFFIYVFIIIALSIFYKKYTSKKILLLFPAFLLYIFLSVSHQSQNIGFRFQATIIISMVYVISSIVASIKIENKHKNYILYLIPILFLMAGLKTINELFYRFNKKPNLEISIPEFTSEFSKKLLKGNETIALTEAGFFSFFQTKNNKLIDLVGLNTPFTAKNKLDQKYYSSINPDVIYYMRPNKMSPEKFNKKLYKKVNTISEFKNSYNLNEIWEHAKFSKVPLATQQSIIYLSNNWGKYDVYFLRYRKDPGRISEYTFAIKKDLKISSNFEKLLDSLKTSAVSKSYYALIKK